MVKCPYCNCEGGFKELRNTRKFLFYSVKRVQCPKCGGIFSIYSGVSPKGKRSEFVIRVKPR
jgi:nitrite reductase/ring-hydroxylating ferredoxin subunit